MTKIGLFRVEIKTCSLSIQYSAITAFDHCHQSTSDYPAVNLNLFPLPSPILQPYRRPFGDVAFISRAAPDSVQLRQEHVGFRRADASAAAAGTRAGTAFGMRAPPNHDCGAAAAGCGLGRRASRVGPAPGQPVQDQPLPPNSWQAPGWYVNAPYCEAGLYNLG